MMYFFHKVQSNLNIFIRIRKIVSSIQKLKNISIRQFPNGSPFYMNYAFLLDMYSEKTKKYRIIHLSIVHQIAKILW